MPHLFEPKPTVWIEPDRLSRSLGIEVTLAVETFQWTGSFKYRAAHNVVSNISNPRVIAASSGNFGQAMAFACVQSGKGCTVVMPVGSSTVKVEAVRSYGAKVEFVDTTLMSREARVGQLATDDPEAYIASAFDDPLVIEGNASLGDEIATSGRSFDAVIAPVGGGGLTAGLAIAFAKADFGAKLIGAEPAMANDAARSLKSGTLTSNESEPRTMADGARTRSLGKHNWEILRTSLGEIIEVREAEIGHALRSLFTLANLKAEPTGALAIGALIADPARFAGSKVLCVISGGNVEAGIYTSVLATAD